MCPFTREARRLASRPPVNECKHGVNERKHRTRPGGGDVYMDFACGARQAPLTTRQASPSDCWLVNGREFAFQRVLLRLGLEEAARGVFRDVVELTILAPAQISRITNAVTDVDQREQVGQEHFHLS